MSSNPYSDNDPQSPYEFQSQTPNAFPSQNPTGISDAYVKQIPVVGILNLVQAVLELIVCVILIGVAVMIPFMQNDPKFKNIPNAPPMAWIAIGYAIFGALLGVMALLRLAAGTMILRKRGRIFSIVASVLGLASVFTCYCSLTSIALCIYSLIILVQPSVMEEFDRRAIVY